MSSKVYSENQQRWFKAVHLTIVKTIETKLFDTKANTPVYDHLNWRLAVNLFNASEYERAFPVLESVAGMEEIFFTDDTNITSWVHQITGRCAAQLFYKTLEYSYLERAYKHYQNAVQTMVVNLFTMFKLPLLLLEFGRVLEDYGAFQASSDLYTRILTGFPNFRGYFDALYRSAIVGRHLASLLPESPAKEESVNKCLDIIQFLLEALPPSISDYQIVLLYGRTLEMSVNPQVKFRAHSIYRSLFDLCQLHFVAGANKIKDASEWLEDPQSWFNLGQEIAASGEPLVAKDAYRKFMELKQKQAASSYSYEMQDIAAHLDTKTCLVLALSAARYQNYEEATEYAELGLRVDRYDKELRRYISLWSQFHAAEMNTEVGAVQSILSVWKGRCWTNGFRRKLKMKMIEDNEERYRINRFDWEARDNLAYYAKDKYRAKFMFEEFCAVRLQRYVRERKKQGVWMDVQRQHQFTLASEVHRRYLRSPYNATTREDLLRISSHRLVPAKHPIHSARAVILEQNKAMILIERCMHTYRIRRALMSKIRETKHRRAKKIFSAARTIQCAMRRVLAVMAMEARYRLLERYAVAARIIQRWIRRLNGSFYVTVLKIKDAQKRQRKRAFELLRTRLPTMVKSFLLLRRNRVETLKARKIEEEERQKNVEQQKKMDKASKMIQNFQKFKQRKFLSKLSKEAIQKRKEANLSIASTELVTHALIDKSMQYQIPGINQQSKQFVRATQQQITFCSGMHKFSPADCLMLSMVLRSPACNIKTLILHEIEDVCNPCFEFDLLAALRKCVSLRAIYILGGDWEESFLQALTKIVHIENPRLTSLMIEQVKRAGMYVDALAISAGRMLMDYFNYSIPGVSELCLHGCCLGDSNVDLIASGIAVNTSIKNLTLSLNLIEDAGFIRIFKAFVGNKRSKIEKLDFSYNLIQANREVKRLFLEYEPHDLKYFLVVNLMYNRIYEFYHPVNDLVQRGLRASSLSLVYSSEDLIALAHPNHQLSSRDAITTPSPNAVDALKPPVGTSKLRMLRKLHSASASGADSTSSGGSSSLSRSIISRSSTSIALLSTTAPLSRINSTRK